MVLHVVTRIWIGPFLVFVLFVAAAEAETFTVTKEADDNGVCEPDDCSLREALLAANALPGRDTVFVPAGIYRVELPGLGGDIGSFDIRDDLDLIGEPGTELVGDGSDRVLAISIPVFPSPPISVVINSIIVTHGRGGGNGGCIRIDLSDVVIRNSLIRDCVSTNDGGGIASNLGSLLLENSTIMDSVAHFTGGGVIHVGTFQISEPGGLEIVNSTLTRNHALQGGGLGLLNRPDLFSMTNTTIADNTADFRASAFVGLDVGAADLLMANNLIEGTCSLGRVPTSFGGNLESPGDTCFLENSDDQVNVPDAGLGELTGDLVPVLPLLEGSPAIDAGVNSDCPPTDQRGVSRPVNGDHVGEALCDAGAVEALPPSLEIPVLDPRSLVLLAALLSLVGLRAIR